MEINCWQHQPPPTRTPSCCALIYASEFFLSGYLTLFMLIRNEITCSFNCTVRYLNSREFIHRKIRRDLIYTIYWNRFLILLDIRRTCDVFLLKRQKRQSFINVKLASRSQHITSKRVYIYTHFINTLNHCSQKHYRLQGYCYLRRT